MRQIGLVLASAVLMWASFPPLNLGFVVFVAPAPFLYSMRRVRSVREAGWLGFLFGAVFFGALLSWIFVLGAVAWVPLTLFLGAFSAVYAVGLYAARNWSPWRWWLVAVGGWTLWEFVRARWPFGGFPWGSAGYPVGTLAWPRSASQWLGATGWGVLVVGIAAAIVLAVEEERDRRPLEMVGAVVVGFTLLGALFTPTAGGAEIRVAIVQGNSPCPRVHCDNEKVRVYSSHMSLTSDIEPGSVDLVVWGEDSFGGSVNPTFSGDVRRDMGAQASRIGAYLLAGGTRPGPPGTFDNYNILFDPTGEVVGEYMKRHPVPFGEYVPFRGLLGFISQLAEVPNDMRAGDRPVVFPLQVDTGAGFLGSVISFEGAFARTIRSEVKAGAQVLVVATNEGSYGRGSASDQLIGMVRMSAASLGTDIVHAAVTGRSTIIDADGSLGETTELFTEEVLVGTVHLQHSRQTFYARVGDWLQVLMILALAALLVEIARHPTRAFKIRPERRR